MDRPSNWTRMGLYLFCLVLPFDGYSIETPFVAVTAANVFLVSMAVAMTSELLLLGRPTCMTSLGKMFSFLLLWWLGAEGISWAAGPSPQIVGVRPLITIGGFIATFIITLGVARDRRTLQGTLAALVLGVLVFSLMTVAAGFFGPFEFLLSPTYPRTWEIVGYQINLSRQLASGIEYGTFAVLIAVTLPWLLLGIKAPELPVSLRVMSFAGTLLLCVAAFVSGSRNVWLSTLSTGLLATIFGAVFLSARLRWVLPLLGIASVTALLLAVSPMWELVRSAAADVASIRVDTLESRLLLNSVALDVFLEHPLLGVGTGFMSNEFVTRFGNYVHNRFLFVLASLGIVGAVPFFAMFGLALVSLGRLIVSKGLRLRAFGVAGIAAMGGIIVALQFYPGLSIKPLAILLALVANGRMLFHEQGSKTPSSDAICTAGLRSDCRETCMA